MRLMVCAAVVLTAAVTLTGVVVAQVSLDRVVLGTAGGTMTSGNLRLDLTIGQTIAGTAQSGAAEVDLGFWWQVPNTLVTVDHDAPPTRFALDQGAPNPFAGSTVVSYAIPAGQHVSVFIGVYDVRGRLAKTLVDRPHDPGRYRVSWDGSGDRGATLSAGIYFMRIQAGPFVRTTKLVVLR